MAQKQDPPKKIMKAPKGVMTPPSRKNMLERVDKIIKKSAKPKSSVLKNALAKGDRISAAQSFTARAAKKIATGAGKAFKSLPSSVKVDSTKKVTPIGGSKPSFTIKKETTIKPAKPIAENMPYKPNFVTKTDKGTGKQTRVIVGGPKVENLPSKIQYTTDKFGNKKVLKPSNPVTKLKGK